LTGMRVTLTEWSKTVTSAVLLSSVSKTSLTWEARSQGPVLVPLTVGTRQKTVPKKRNVVEVAFVAVEFVSVTLPVAEV